MSQKAALLSPTQIPPVCLEPQTPPGLHLFPFQSLLSFILWTSRDPNINHPDHELQQQRRLIKWESGGLFPHSWSTAFLSSHGWAGQGARTDTTHSPTACSGEQGRKAACKMLFMPSALHLLISLLAEYFKMCPGLFFTTLLPCDFVWSLGKDCQVFSWVVFTLILAFIHQRQSLKLLQKGHLNFYLQAHLPAINQKHSHSAGCHTHPTWRVYVRAFVLPLHRPV